LKEKEDAIMNILTTFFQLSNLSVNREESSDLILKIKFTNYQTLSEINIYTTRQTIEILQSLLFSSCVFQSPVPKYINRPPSIKRYVDVKASIAKKTDFCQIKDG
jgi:hypothetical protein